MALTHALSAPASPVDVGELVLAECCVPLMSSLNAGFDAAVAARAQRSRAWLPGQLRYLWATLGELRVLRRWRLDIRVNGEHLRTGEALFASVLNTPA